MQGKWPSDILTAKRRELDRCTRNLISYPDYSRDIVKAVLQGMAKWSIGVSFGRFPVHERDRADRRFSAWRKQEGQSLPIARTERYNISEFKRHNRVVGMKIVDVICLK